MKTFYQYLAEVSKGQVALIGKRLNTYKPKDEPFEDIFGDKSRIVIPLLTEDMQEFMSYLTKHNMTDIDFKEGTGVIKVPTKQGVSQRKMKIGKFIQSLKDQDKEEWLDFWQKNKVKLENQDGVSIIITRHPLDLLRMSDHKGLKSCHAPDGAFWRCAIQEAKTGGALALVVKNKDLSKVKNLQAKNIFKDYDRGIEGIVPLERLRLRRYDDDKTSYLVPVGKTYGKGHSGFYESVKEWVFKAQAEKLKNVDYDKLERRGGSYEDGGYESDQIWSDFLDQSFSGSKKSIDQEDEETKINNLEEEVEAALRGHNYRHFHVDASVEMADQRQYVSTSGFVGFKIDLHELQQNLPDNDWKERYALENAIRAALDIYTIEQVDWNEYDGELTIGISFRDEEDNGDLDSLEHLLDYVDELDKNYAEYNRAVRHVLWEQGYLSNSADELELKHFKFGYESKKRSNPEYWYESEEIEIGNLEGISDDLVMIGNAGSLLDIGNNKHANFDKLLTDAIKLKKPNLDIKLYIKATENREVEWNSLFHGQPLRLYPNIPVNFYINIGIEDITPEALKEVQDLDNEYPNIVKYVQDWWKGVKTQFTQSHTDPAQHPAIKASITRWQGAFRRLGQEGQVIFKNNNYWYVDKVGGIDMPAIEAKKKIEADLPALRQWKEKMWQDLRRWGEVELKYKNNKPIYLWIDEKTKTTLPVEEAIIKFKEEQDELWGKRP